MTPKAVTPLGLYAYVLAAAVAILDQLSKWWVLDVAHLDLKGQIPVLPFFRLTLVMNRGVSFGLMRADTPAGRWRLVVAALIVVLALIWWVRKADRPLFATAIGFVIGGALGNNLIDRARIGQVVDFLDFSGLMFPWVFNVADSAISIGVALLLWDSFFPGKKPVDGTP
ncbi:MAG: signal peptidase II [Caulobacteraceae bacterium]